MVVILEIEATQPKSGNGGVYSIMLVYIVEEHAWNLAACTDRVHEQAHVSEISPRRTEEKSRIIIVENGFFLILEWQC